MPKKKRKEGKNQHERTSNRKFMKIKRFLAWRDENLEFEMLEGAKSMFAGAAIIAAAGAVVWRSFLFDFYSDLIRYCLLIFLVYIYRQSLFFLFHLSGLMPDFFLASMGSQTLDFGWICYFDDSSSNLPALVPRESSSSSPSATNPYANHPYEIYQRIRILEARGYENVPPQNHPGEYEELVRGNLSRAWNMGRHFYDTIFMNEYFELRVLERKGLLQDGLTNLMLSEPNLSRVLELSPYSNVRQEAYHFIQDRFPPIFLNSLDLSPSRFVIEDSLNCLRSITTNLDRNHSFYKEFYRHFTDEEFRRSVGLPLP